MEDAVFIKIRALLQSRSGLYFSAQQESDLRRGIHNAMLASEFYDATAYYRQLEESDTNHSLWKQLVQQVTVGETYFFRNRWHFQALRDHVLPKMIMRRRNLGLQTLRIWSAGCSTGEEPYSIAILLRELLPDIETWQINILATDINDQALAKGRAGIYGDWSFRTETPDTIREKYFERKGGQSQVIQSVRDMVRFEHLNLVDDVYPTAYNDTINMDIIMCRNVTIYFDRATTRQVVDRFYRSLLDNGWLIVGHAEPLASIYTEYEVHNFENAVLYRKPEATAENKKAALSTKEWIAVSLQLVATDDEMTDGLAEAEQAQELDRICDFIAKGKLTSARLALNRFLDVMPNHLDALFLLAKITADEGQLDDVHDILDEIERINPLVPQAHYLRGLLFEQSAAWQDAKAALRRALYADREFVLAHYHMGELLYSEGNAAMARRSWENALSLLSRLRPNMAVPFGDGMMVGTLLHAIQQRLQSL